MTITSTFNGDGSSYHIHEDAAGIKKELGLNKWNPETRVDFQSQDEIKEFVEGTLSNSNYWSPHYNTLADRRVAEKDYNSDAVKRTRNDLLQKYDWTNTADLTTDEKAAWKTYKTALRNLTKQSGFPYVEDGMEWPTKPS
tara:strand:+ start:3368 stop:3787 length:420 start_codon:yes stop_codon:yes gene_type:complete